MRIKYQAEVERENKMHFAMREAKRRHDEVGDEIHQASHMMGEIVARMNQNKTTKIDDVVNYYKPEYLEKRKTE